jgi:hypothetical protein
MNFGWDERGFVRATGVLEIDRVLGTGDLQDAQDCNYTPAGVLAEMGVDEAYGPALDQYDTGRIVLQSGAVLARGQSWLSVWACTRLPDGHRDPCNGSCYCCQFGSHGQCEGQSTCPEHCPISVGQAAAMGILASRPHAGA